MCLSRRSCSARAGRKAYTLVEVLVVVTILGIAASMIAPSMNGSASLRVQAAVRTLVSDITEMQCEALAYQRGRAIVFYPDENRYVLVEVNGATLDVALDQIRSISIKRDDFGDAKITAADFDGDAVMIFDELGSPVTAPNGSTPAGNGKITITGAGEKFEITIEAYTGRVSVKRVAG